MGIKRFWGEEDFPEPSFKQSKLMEYYIKSPSNVEESHLTTPAIDFPGTNGCKLELEMGFEDGNVTAEKKLDTSAPLFLVTSSSTDEDVGNGSTPGWSTLPGYIELNVPPQSPEPYVDPYVILLNCPPRKEVPIGPEHQADVPVWDPRGDSSAEIDREQRLMGSCILPLPHLNDSGFRAGQGRTECSCLDMGSMRCVQQHVKEVREKFLQIIGDEKFSELGFHDMGEVVAAKWIPEERQIIHEVVLSNPKSNGRNFWKHLGDAFPSRTMKELVSYYFNVFMLHRRAVQNRSFVLEIDSDDDEEWRGTHQNRSHPWEAGDGDDYHDDHHFNVQNTVFRLIADEDGEEDSTVESFGDHDLDADASWVDDFWPEPETTTSRDEVSSGENDGTTSGTEKLSAQNT